MRRLLLLLAILAGDLAAQPAGTRDSTLRVFLDCQNVFCDFDFLRTEIAYVDWVRNRQDADLHLLVTSQPTGSQGREYTIAFIGQGAFAGADQTLRHATPPTMTDDERRRALARTLQLGLGRYLAGSRAADRIAITYQPPAGGATPAASPRDRWNYWIYSVRANANLNGEKSYKNHHFFGNVSANRTTEGWKIRIGTDGSYGESKFSLSEGTFTSYSHSYGLSGLVVKSVGPHWSVGPSASLSASTFLNAELVARGGLAAEYDIFPYSESTRRQLTFHYRVSAERWDYDQVTIYDRETEGHFLHSLSTTLDLKQRWGSIELSLNGSQYYFDPSKYQIGSFAEVDVRLFKGLSINGFVSASLLRNQLYLQKGGLTDEEVLTRRRQLATSYRYFSFAGLQYRFGSIYNNIVNPRFGNFDF